MLSTLFCVPVSVKLLRRLCLVLVLFLAAPGAGASRPPQDPVPESARPQAAEVLEIPGQSRVFLTLKRAIQLHSARLGDPVFCEVYSPVIAQNRIGIPAGSFAEAEIAEVRHSGRIRRSVEIHIRIQRIILRNGYTIELRGAPPGAGPALPELSAHVKVTGGGYPRASVITGAVVGALSGAVIGGFGGSARGTLAFAGIGGLVGLSAASPSTTRPREIPRGAVLSAVLDIPLRVEVGHVNVGTRQPVD